MEIIDVATSPLLEELTHCLFECRSRKGLTPAGAAARIRDRRIFGLAMVASLGEDFQGDAVRVVLFDAPAGLSAEWLQVIPVRDKRMAPFKDCITSNEPLCGRLNPDKMELLFGDDHSQAQSVALIPVAGVGLLAVGSRDGNRFFPGMGTLFLRLMGESFAAALARFGHA